MTLFVLHCIEVYYVYCTCVVNRWVRVLKMNYWTVGELLQSSSSIPNSCWYLYFRADPRKRSQQEKRSRNKRKFRVDPPLEEPNKRIPSAQHESLSYEFSAEKFEITPRHGQVSTQILFSLLVTQMHYQLWILIFLFLCLQKVSIMLHLYAAIMRHPIVVV